jgi:ribosomal protein L11 methyltransferase
MGQPYFRSMYWLEVSVTTDGEAAEAVAEVLRPFAHADGVVLEQLGDQTDLAPDALEPHVTVKIYIAEEDDSATVRRRIEESLYHMNRLYPISEPVFRQLADEDWAEAWKAHYHPFRVGNRIWIQPTWVEETDPAAPALPDAVILRLDPGMAFGTGLHPTTQMCLQALEMVTQSGQRVLDLGTGSGILGIAALKLGATWVLGVDNDKLAVQTAVANAAANGVDGRFQGQLGTLADVAAKDWDLVLVNILAPVIVDLLQNGDLLSYGGGNGRFVFSGIIDQQATEVEQAIAAAGGTIENTLFVRDWISYVVAS